MISKELLKLLEDSADQILNMLNELGLTDAVSIDYSEIDDEGDLIVSFTSKDSEEEMTVAFGLDDDGTPIALYVDSEDDKGNARYVDLSDLEVPIKDGKIDFTDLSQWLDPEVLIDILDGDNEEGEFDEASVFVVRGGKKVKKLLVRKKRKKVMTSARRQAIRKAVITRRKTQAATNRKRAKSLKLRKRLNIKKNKNQRLKVSGTGGHL